MDAERDIVCIMRARPVAVGAEFSSLFFIAPLVEVSRHAGLAQRFIGKKYLRERPLLRAMRLATGFRP